MSVCNLVSEPKKSANFILKLTARPSTTNPPTILTVPLLTRNKFNFKAIRRLFRVSASPASCPQGTADFSRGDKSGRSVKLTTHLHLVPEVKKKIDLQSHSVNVTRDTALSLIKPSAHYLFIMAANTNLSLQSIRYYLPFRLSIPQSLGNLVVYPPNIRMYLSRLSPVSYTGPNKERVKML